MDKQILILDVETTTYNKGHWADKRNKLVMFGAKWLNETPWTIYYDNVNMKYEVMDAISDADIVVGHNIKFDLHWLCNIGVSLSSIKRVWDTQIAEFLLEAQRNPYNSLNDACDKYNIPRKLDIVKEQFWDKGINTDEIPPEILREYLEGDLDRTERVFRRQYEQFTSQAL